MSTFIVTTTSDRGAGSLRQAIADANANAGADEIRFDATVFDGGAEDVIRLTSGQIRISDGLTIVGGPAGVTITGDAKADDVTDASGVTDLDLSYAHLRDNSRIFDAGADLTIQGLTLTGGNAQGASQGGGAVRSSASVWISGSTLSGNMSYSGGGGVYASGHAYIGDSVIANNASTWGTGGVFARSLDVSDSEFRANRMIEDQGSGASALSGTYVRIVDSTISDNHGPKAAIGGLSVRLVDSVVSGNRAFYSAGGISSGGDVYVAGSTISENKGAGAGGISGRWVMVVASAVTDNVGLNGGGGITGTTSVSLVNSTVSGNVARFSPYYGYSEIGRGGGVLSLLGDVTALNSTITGNIVQSPLEGSAGGGIYARSISLENSIVLGNTALAGAETSGDLSLFSGNIVGDGLYSGSVRTGGVDATGVFVETVEIAPGVLAGVLADNGGPTETVAIRGEGPAAGAAETGYGHNSTRTDQRGVPRAVDDSDLGAFEAAPPQGLTLVGGPGPNRLTGGELDDRIRGHGGDDALRGRGGDDHLLGDNGDDVIRGGDGDDIIRGGAGRDVIIGGAGDDTLRGDGGDDIFVFGKDFGRDQIFGFNALGAGTDLIDLRLLGVTAATFDEVVSITHAGLYDHVTVEDGGEISCRVASSGGGDGLQESDFLLLA
ncbi:choice-of-anchor Q domain-containing protein [Amaricoccus sp.]|uniref:calcium-binding protein n=1 Tax=Amaricoccus sp. TaxID=1872485 RepID=UPI001B3FA6A4|nr:choice-of-anchor Q domain-containing protein [Amaricoccus sp.]MBP6999936.1 hypothetical protein [Amaricoccus sp.]